MIWSWVKSLVTGSPASPVSASAAPSTGDTTAAVRSRREPEWTNLPPVQRALDRPLSPVAPLDAFTESLTAHQNPSFLAPLRHVVDPIGSGGLVTGLARTIPSTTRHYASNAHLSVPSTQHAPAPVQRQRMTWAPDADGTAPRSGSPGDVDDADAMSPGDFSPESTANSIPIQRSLAVVDSPPPRRPTFPNVVERELPVVTQTTPQARSESATVALSPAEDRVHAAAEEPPSEIAIEATAPLGGFSAAINALQGESPAEAGTSAATPTPPSAADRGPVMEVQRLEAGPSTHDPVPLDTASHGTVDSSSRPWPHTTDSASLPPLAVPVELPVDVAPHRRDPSVAHSPDTSSPTPPERWLRSTAEGPPQRSSSAPVQRLPVLPVVGSEAKRHTSPLRGREQGADIDTVGQSTAPLVSTPIEADHSPEAISPPLQIQREPASPVEIQLAADHGLRDEAEGSPATAEPPAAAMPVLTRNAIADGQVEKARAVGLLPEKPPLLTGSPGLQRLPKMPANSGMFAIDNLPIQRISHAPHTDDVDPRPVTTPQLGSTTTAAPVLPVITGTPTSYQRPPTVHTVGLLAERPPLVPASDLVRTTAVSAPVQRITRPSTIAPPDRSHPTLSTPMGSSWTPGTTAPEEVRRLIRPVDEQHIPVQRAVPTMAPPNGERTRSSTTESGVTRLDPPSSSDPPIHAVGPAVSFTSMFSATATDEHPAGADGFTSVQLQPERVEPDVSLQTQPSSQVAELLAESSTPTPTATIGTAPGNSSDPKVDLDEMARQLFEPLSARLRAELWLDRERAGLLSDVRH